MFRITATKVYLNGPKSGLKGFHQSFYQESHNEEAAARSAFHLLKYFTKENPGYKCEPVIGCDAKDKTIKYWFYFTDVEVIKK